jgi:hypothetical protein
MDWDSQFNPKRFTDPSHLSEGLLMDRKWDLPEIAEDPKKRIDFIKDFIALANMSYRFGRVARILFGIDNSRKILGVSKATKAKYLQGIDLNIESDREKFFNERILSHFYREIKKFVTPSSVHLVMHWGDVKDTDGQDKLVAYLEIRAETGNRFAYRFKESKIAEYQKFYQDYENPNLPLSWKREGEINSKFLTQEEYDNWLSFSDCPVISGSKWRAYFDKLSSDDFRVAHILEGYQEPKAVDGKLLTEKVKDFQGSRDTLLVIEGAAGMGKTFFLRREVYRIAQEAIPYCRDLPDDAPPAYFLPIYRELQREIFRRESNLAIKALQWWNIKMVLARFSPKAPKACQLFRRQDTQWILFLDALDEMDVRSIKNFKLALEEFRVSYPDVKIIITTRPDVVDPEWRANGIVVTMQPLDEISIHSFLEASIQGEYANDELTLAKKLLNDHPQLLELVRVPLYLKAYSEEFISSDDQQDDDDEPYPLSRVLEKMLDKIWAHNSKHFHVDREETAPDERITKLSQLAAKADGENLCELETGKREVGGKRVLNRFLSIGFLEIRNSWLRFRSDIVQCYFAAKHLDYIWRSSMKMRRRRIRQLIPSPNSFWEHAFNFYKEISYDAEAIQFVLGLIEKNTGT